MESWEDWETEDPETIVINVEAQAKRAEERRQIEESETTLAHELFSTTPAHPTPTVVVEKKRPADIKPKNHSKKVENEQKQKAASNAAKMLKAMKQRERELFGEIDEDELDVKYDYYYS